MGDYTFFFKYDNEIRNRNDTNEKDPENLDPPLSKDIHLNYAIHHQLAENNEYRLDHLNNEENDKLKKVLYDFKDIQYHKGDNLTFTSTIKHAIQTVHEDPVYRHNYKYAQILDQEVKQQINDMMKQRIVHQ